MRFVQLIALTLVTSLDSLGVGVAFGLKGTRIRVKAHMVISAVMLVITAAGVFLGNKMTDFLPERDARWLSAFLFVAVGVGMLIPLVRAIRTGRFCYNPDDGDCCPLRLADKACEVSLRDAFGLGFLLSINNVGGGLSAGLIHLTPIEMGLWSVAFNILCLCVGHKMGSTLRRTPVRTWAQGLAAATMVAIGIYQLCGG